MAGGFDKYLGAEDRIQHSFITWMKLAHPKIRYHHSPSEGRRTPFERFKMKYLGTDSGFPDIIIPKLNLVIEFKAEYIDKVTGKKKGRNTLSEEQKAWIEYFAEIGWQTCVAYSFEQGQEAVNKALLNHKTK